MYTCTVRDIGEREKPDSGSYLDNLSNCIRDISINTQVIIQNRALSLARYLGLSADNHLDGQNGCQ